MSLRSRSESLSNSLDILDRVEEFEKGDIDLDLMLGANGGKFLARLSLEDESSSVLSMSMSISSSFSRFDVRVREAVMAMANGVCDAVYSGRKPGLGVVSPTDPDLETDLSSSLSVSYPL